MDLPVLALFAFGYPVSITVIARWLAVVRERRIRWFVWHQAAVAAIVLGWTIEGRTAAIIVNSTWFIVAAVWFLARRDARRP